MTISDPPVSADASDYAAYRALSKSAIVSVSFAILAAGGVLAIPLMVFALCGLLFGVISLRALKRYPNELTGRGPAWAGIVLSLAMFTGAAGRHTWIYLTEVPEGYQRISFYDLRPRRRSMELVSGTAVDLNGKKVFIKGYMHPGVKDQGKVQQFVLVPDMKTCCFGGQPDLFDMMEVTLTGVTKGKTNLKYSTQKLKLAGDFVINVNVLTRNQQKQVAGRLVGGLFELRVDQVR
ncbi:MAG: DUF4190 domain-containing protein [Planctomycetota bacterium]|nr:DUF4190 domain-containing protein [Planctomycetota bacterium]